MSVQQTKAEMLKKFLSLGGEVDEDGMWVVWKYVTNKLGSPTYWSSLRYVVGHKTTDKLTANTDPSLDCEQGLNVHAAQPPKKHFYHNNKTLRIIECRVDPKDVACIPTAARQWKISDGFHSGPKFRVQILKVVASYEYSSTDKGGLQPIKIAAGYEFTYPMIAA